MRRAEIQARLAASGRTRGRCAGRWQDENPGGSAVAPSFVIHCNIEGWAALGMDCANQPGQLCFGSTFVSNLKRITPPTNDRRSALFGTRRSDEIAHSVPRLIRCALTP